MHARSLVPGFLGWLAVLFLAAGVPRPAEAQRIPALSLADSVHVTPAPPPPPLSTRVRVNLGPEDNHWDVPPDRTMELPRTPEWRGTDFDVSGRYNRVEGIFVHGQFHRELDRDTFVPAATAGLGYAFAAERGQYRLGFEQPVAPRNRVTVGAEGYRSFLPFFYQDESLSTGENTASAFFLHEDYWNWYEAEGMRGFVRLHPSPFLTVSVGAMRQDERTLVNHTDWSLFNQKDDFRRNPGIPDGDVHSWEASLTFDSRPHDSRDDCWERSTWKGVEHLYRLAWERADGGLGGDYDLWRMHLDLRNYFRLSSRQLLATRILAGTGEARSGLLPDQRRFAIGGLGTLRGHNYRSVSGDRTALANLEYSFSTGGEGYALIFLDAGTAWDAGSLFDQRIAVDAGGGFRLGHDGITILAAQSVNRSNADFKMYVRLQESF